MFYKITLTASGGLSKDNLEEIKTYFTPNPHVYLTVEYGESGSNCHVEGIVEYASDKTSNVTRRIKTLYSKMEIDVVFNTIKVCRATHLVGALIYASKELEKQGELLLLQGWTQSWIDQQVKENVKSIPYKMLKKQGTRVTQNAGGALMYEYAIANNMVVTSRQDYIEVVKLMGCEGYLFGSTRHKGIFQDVCALFGDGSAASAVADAELHWL